MEEPLPDLLAEPEIGGMFLVFTAGGIPLGSRSIATAELPIPGAALRELALRTITPAVGDHLLEHGFRARLPLPRSAPPHDRPPSPGAVAALQSPLDELRTRLREEASSGSPGPVSVIVCTRDRPDDLRRCLGALALLDPAPHEIVVVDNAPRSEAVRELVRATPGVRYVREPRPGLSVARNAGVRASTGGLIAFTDDDVIVDPTWLVGLRRGFRDPRVLAVTGLVLPAELETEAQFLFQHGDSGFGWGFRPLVYDREYFDRMRWRGVPVWHIGAGANMAFRREVFARVGLFDERLGAGASGCSEDSEMWYRILAGGARCRYEPTAVVHHVHRRDMAGLEDQMRQYMRGHVAALLIQWQRHRHPGNLVRAFGLLPAYYARRVLRRAALGTLGAEVAGSAAGIGFYLRHRHAPSVSPPPERAPLTSHPGNPADA
ncbi:MAG: glycosyltransferase [Gemmatimonadota bacterium]|nr:glycosyltransferase [Gemmatimonadota bacterium]